MKKIILMVLFALLISTSSSEAQTKKEPAKKSKSKSTEVREAKETRPPDSLYLHHPYYNGEPQYTDADTMYKYGRFPWPLVKQHPENYRYNPTTGKWETLVTPNHGEGNARKRADKADD